MDRDLTMPCRVNLSLAGDWLKSQFSTSVFKKNMKLMRKWIPHFSFMLNFTTYKL